MSLLDRYEYLAYSLYSDQPLRKKKTEVMLESWTESPESDERQLNAMIKLKINNKIYLFRFISTLKPASLYCIKPLLRVLA